MNKFNVGDKVSFYARGGKLIIGKVIDSIVQLNGDVVRYQIVSLDEPRDDYLVSESRLTIVDGDVDEQHKQSGKIKSDGGSSSYYDLPISNKLLVKLNQRKEEGECYVKTEDLIEEVFCDSFGWGTMGKSMVRGYLQTKGGGKEGNDLEYELNKVLYYVNKVKEKDCENLYKD